MNSLLDVLAPASSSILLLAPAPALGCEPAIRLSANDALRMLHQRVLQGPALGCEPAIRLSASPTRQSFALGCEPAKTGTEPCRPSY
jgi:hypothetical protein